MKLAGQGGGCLTILTCTLRLRGRDGYAMAALLVSVAVMSVLMSAAMPVWRHQAIREKEAELVFRGEQYARAIALYQRKLGPGSLPPTIDVLVEQRFLRRKYEDPMSPDGEFQLLFASQQAGGGRGRGGQPQASTGGGLGPPSSADPTPAGQAGQAGGTPGLRGGIIGVTSKSAESSIRVYNGATHYNEWQFLFTQFAAQPGTQGGQPGMQPGQPMRGGQRGGQRGLEEGGRGGRGGQRGRGGLGPGQGPGGRGPGTVGPGIVRPPGGRGPGG